MSNQTPMSAEAYLKQELTAARKSLRNTQIFGILIVGLLSLYLIIVTVKFTNFFKPESASEIATGFIVGQIEQYRDGFVADVQQRIPALIQQVPDYLLKQMPVARKEVTQNFEDELRKYCQSTIDQLNTQLDQYFTQNKAQIQAVLEETNDPKAVAVLGPTISDQLIKAYLEEASPEGESVHEQVTASLAILKEAQQRLHRLATATDLTPEEKKTKRAIAVTLETINRENLEPVSLPLKVEVPQP